MGLLLLIPRAGRVTEGRSCEMLNRVKSAFRAILATIVNVVLLPFRVLRKLFTHRG